MINEHGVSYSEDSIYDETVIFDQEKFDYEEKSYIESDESFILKDE